MYYYTAFNLIVKSDIQLPIFKANPTNSCDIEIKQGIVPKQIKNLEINGALYTANKSEFLLQVPNMGKTYAKNGNTIIYDTSSEKHLLNLIPFILTTTMGALLIQRNNFLLHASALTKGNNAILISGKSGAGKSTFAAELGKQGYQLVTDDISLLNINNNKLQVTFAYPYLKLWSDTIDLLSLNKEYLMPIRNEIQKYYYTKSNFTARSFDIKAIHFIEVNHTDKTKFEKIDGSQKFAYLNKHLYLKKLAQNTFNNQFIEVANTLTSINITNIIRPRENNINLEIINYISND